MPAVIQPMTMGAAAAPPQLINPGAVPYRPVESRTVTPPQLDLGGLDRAASFFTRETSVGIDELERANLQDVSEQVAKQKQADAEQGVADANNPNLTAMDPAKSNLVAYSHAYTTAKGKNQGDAMWGQFYSDVGASLQPGQDPVAAATDWLKKNPGTTGDPNYDANMLATFNAHMQQFGLQQRDLTARVAHQDGISALTSSLGGDVENLRLTPEGIQQAINQARSLNVADPSKAPAIVTQAILGAANNPIQMHHVLAQLDAPGSFAPGVSFHQQFPQLYNQINDTYARHMQEATSVDGQEFYNKTTVALHDALAAGDLGSITKAGGILDQLDQGFQKYSGWGPYMKLHDEADSAIKAGAAQMAGINTISASLGNPDKHDGAFVEAWDKNGDKYLQANGFDLTGSGDSAAQAVNAIALAGKMPKAQGQAISAMLTDSTNPQRQAQAFSTLQSLSSRMGEATMLGALPENARALYTAAQAGTMGGGNVQSWFTANGSPDARTDDKLTWAGIASKPNEPQGIKAANDAAKSALSSTLSVNGTFDPTMNVDQNVIDRMRDAMKAQAGIAAKSGPVDVNSLAAQVAKQVQGNILVTPGNDGRRNATWFDNLPTQITDPRSGQPAQAVPLTRSVFNPATGKTEDTTAVAEADLSALPGSLPDRFAGRQGLALVADPHTTTGDLYRRSGVLTVTDANGPVMFGPGQTLALKTPPGSFSAANVPMAQGEGGVVPAQVGQGAVKPAAPTLTLPADPRAAQEAWAKAMPGSPFMLQPVQSMNTQTHQSETHYMLVYQPHFMPSGAGLDAREAGWKGVAPVTTGPAVFGGT